MSLHPPSPACPPRDRAASPKPRRAEFRRLVVALLAIAVLVLQGCAAGSSGFKSYVDTGDGYEFLYPNGWIPVQTSGGPDVVFRDLIQETENASVVVGDVPGDRQLTDLGSPSEVGYRLAKTLAPPDSGRTAELTNAARIDRAGQTYYLLEYAVQLPDSQRHNLASVAVSHGKLYTLNASTLERRWPQVKDSFDRMVQSFQVY